MKKFGSKASSSHAALVSSKVERYRDLFILSFLSPAVLLYTRFVVWPLLQSFQVGPRWRGLSQHRQFVGLENYKKLAQDDAFKRSLEHNLALLTIILVGAIVLGVVLAHAMQAPEKPPSSCEAFFPQVIRLGQSRHSLGIHI